MTFSDCWIRKAGEPVPEELGAKFKFGNLGVLPGPHHYWVPAVREWAEAVGLPIEWKDSDWLVIRATPAQVSAFLEHIYGPEGAAERIASLDAGAMYDIIAEEF